MMTQNSKQSQNNKNIKKSVSYFHNRCNEKGRKRFTLRKHNVIWKTMRTPVLEFLGTLLIINGD